MILLTTIVRSMIDAGERKHDICITVIGWEVSPIPRTLTRLHTV